jgi:hypothetical protein
MNTDLTHNAIQATQILGGKIFANTPERGGYFTANTGVTTLCTVSQEKKNPTFSGGTWNTSGMLICLATIDHKDYFLKTPIILTVTEHDSEYVVTFGEAELSRSGSTIPEAINWLESSMVSLYELYKGESRLGPLPQRQLRMLGQYIGEKKTQPHRSR